MTIEPDKLRAVRLPSLNGLRWVAAILVFATHVTDQAPFVSGSFGGFLTTVFARGGYGAVSFFFVLSGFVLTWSARPNDRPRGFWRRRFFRIYPNHFVTMVLAGVLMVVTAAPLTAKTALAHTFLVQTWWPDAVVWKSLNSSSWTLACEGLFYLCFPLVLKLVRKLSVRGLWILGAVVTALVIAVPFVARYWIGGTPLPFWSGSPSFEQIWFVYLFPPVRILECVLGVVLALLVKAGAWPKIGLLPAVVVAIIGYVVSDSVLFVFGVSGIAAIWIAPLVAAAAQADIAGRWTPFRNRLMVKLGDLTFSFYMIQGIVVTYAYIWIIAGHHVTSLGGGIATVLVTFVISFVLAYGLYTFVERPMMRRFGEPKRRTPPPAPPVERELVTLVD